MPSQQCDSGWSFSSVYDLIDLNAHDVSSPALAPKVLPVAAPLQGTDGGIHLGSFSKLYESLGFAQDQSLAPPSLDVESKSSASDTLLPSPVIESKQSSDDLISSADDGLLTHHGLTKKQRKKARKRAEKERLEAKKAEQRQDLREHSEILSGVAAKHEPADTPTRPSRVQSRSNVGAKIRVSSPVLDAKHKTLTNILESEPRTPQAHRPSSLQRPSITTSITSKPWNEEEIFSIEEAISKVAQFTISKNGASAQQSFGPQLVSQPQFSQVAAPIIQGRGLVPRTVRPVSVPRRSQPVVAQLPSTPIPTIKSLAPSQNIAAPIQSSRLVIRSQVDRHFNLFNKLLDIFPDDRRWLVAPMQLINEKTTSHGLHVFVDASNIMIGFKDMLRSHGIPPYQYDMSFDSLALLMERRRPVAKRVFAGSHREASPLPHITKLVDTSKAVGYDSVMQEQVLIVREDSEKKKFFKDVKKHGWYKATQLHSGSGSDSETGPPVPKTPSAPKWVEQGVDEILHLKMCQSIIDTDEPGTMVLATGDGAVAEMSDGFLAHVERALKRGWKVELISWAQQTNGGYKNRKFRAKWGEQFQIIELDRFLEDLIDTP